MSGGGRSHWRREVRWYLEAGLFLAVSFLVSLLPGRVALAIGRVLGLAFYLVLRRRRRIAIENIAASLPYLQSQPDWNPANGDAAAIARRTFENLGRSVVEDCKLYHGRGQRMIEEVEFRGLEHYERARARGKGVAFITGHCGNWELMALSFGARYQEIAVLARRQNNRHLNGVLERIRQRLGNSVIYKGGALRGMLARFKQNGVVGILIDQAVSPEDGVLVDFLGRPAWTTDMLVSLARKAQVPLVPIFIHREGGRQVAAFEPEIEVSTSAQAQAEDTARLTRCIERYVIRYPDQWYWIHKRWKRAPTKD